MKEIYEETGLRIDLVIQGKGTSNTGNVARSFSFFFKYRTMSRITGIEEDLLKNIYILFICISNTRFKISKESFTPSSSKVHDKCFDLYGSVHNKLLFHAGEVAEYFDCPIGALADENIECSHTIVNNCRTFFSRKIIRCATNTDIMTRFLSESDPKISGIRRIEPTKLTIPPECLLLLIGKKPFNLTLFFYLVFDLTDLTEEEEDDEDDSSGDEINENDMMIQVTVMTFSYINIKSR